MYKITHVGDDYILIESEMVTLDVTSKEIDLFLGIQLFLAWNLEIDESKINKKEFIKLVKKY